MRNDHRVVPPVVAVGKYVRMIDTSGLTQHQKHILWSGIKTVNPALADALKNDANIAALKSQFNATVQIPVDEFNRYLQSGIKALEERKS